MGASVDGAPNIINCMTHRMDAFVAPRSYTKLISFVCALDNRRSLELLLNHCTPSPSMYRRFIPLATPNSLPRFLSFLLMLQQVFFLRLSELLEIIIFFQLTQKSTGLTFRDFPSPEASNLTGSTNQGCLAKLAAVLRLSGRYGRTDLDGLGNCSASGDEIFGKGFSIFNIALSASISSQIRIRESA